MIRRMLQRLAHIANWRCPACDTYNDPDDIACHICATIH